MRPVHRIEPVIPVQKMQTYKISKPVATHTRPATCEEIDCPDFLNGWVTRLPHGDPRITFLRQACAGRVDGHRRQMIEVTRIDSAEREFLFNPGQPCLKATTHRKDLERPEIYLVRGGDWRANLGLIRRHTHPEHWVEDMQENLEAVERRLR
jgi:hypothetical protein